MTDTTKSLAPMFFSATLAVAVNEDGKKVIDWETSIEAFKIAAEERFNRESTNETEILQVLNKNATERVTTEALVSRIIANRERAETRKLLIADDEAEDFEYTPDQRKAVKENLEATLENLKSSGAVIAKAGKSGGVQTAENDRKMPVKSKALGFESSRKREAFAPSRKPYQQETERSL